MLQPGSPIPMLATGDGRSALAAGKRHVLYFFPKAGTPACIMEACSFRDNLALLRRRDRGLDELEIALAQRPRGMAREGPRLVVRHSQESAEKRAR